MTAIEEQDSDNEPPNISVLEQIARDFVQAPLILEWGERLLFTPQKSLKVIKKLLGQKTIVREFSDVAIVLSENYFFKSRAYYKIIELENMGKLVYPGSKDVLRAFNPPLCERLCRISGIPTVHGEIDNYIDETVNSNVNLPALIYSLNPQLFYGKPFLLTKLPSALKLLEKITQDGDIPFYIQQIPESARIISVNSIFGYTIASDSPSLSSLVQRIFQLFPIPLMTLNFMVFEEEDKYILASIQPCRVSKLNIQESTLLERFLWENWEFS